MLKQTTYYPVVKWKTGERIALQELREEQKNKIIPIAEVVDSDLSISSFLDVCASFPNPFVVDTIFVDDERTMLLEMLNQAMNRNQQLIPLLYVSDIETPDSEIITKAANLAILMPVPADFEGPSYESIFEAISRMGKSPNKIDLILDLGMITDRGKASTAYDILKSFLATHTARLSQFRKVVIRCSSFPTDLSSVQSGTTVSFTRYDIKMFYQLINGSVGKPYLHQLAFSDYGVTKFTETDIDFSLLKYGILPKIKYTTSDSYFVSKGKKDHERGEWILSYKDLSRMIVAADYYYGQNFSFGDQQIFDISQPNNKIGNSTNWVTFCANHHIAVVVDELSNLVYP